MQSSEDVATMGLKRPSMSKLELKKKLAGQKPQMAFVGQDIQPRSEPGTSDNAHSPAKVKNIVDSSPFSPDPKPIKHAYVKLKKKIFANAASTDGTSSTQGNKSDNKGPDGDGTSNGDNSGGI